MNELHCKYKYSYAKILHLLLKNHSWKKPALVVVLFNFSILGYKQLHISKLKAAKKNAYEQTEGYKKLHEQTDPGGGKN